LQTGFQAQPHRLGPALDPIEFLDGCQQQIHGQGRVGTRLEEAATNMRLIKCA
jgi:hypothetical protein